MRSRLIETSRTIIKFFTAMGLLAGWPMHRVAMADDAGNAVRVQDSFLPRQHLHIEYGITDAAYRQQVLNLIPLGSTYTQVKAFVISESQFQKFPLKPSMLKSDFVVQSPLVLYRQSFLDIFGTDYKKVLLSQPPHIKVSDPAAPFTSQQGKGYIIPIFYSRPVWWKRELYVSVFCIFDNDDKLVDVFARCDEVRRPTLLSPW